MDVKSSTLVLLLITLHTKVFSESAAKEITPSVPEKCNILSSCEIKLGPKGEPGPMGPLGSEGENGDRGIPGDPGTSGVPGAKGEKGPIGLQGADGEKGEIGPHGEPGTPGVKGDKGSTGPVGIPGLDGVCYQICPDQSDPDDETGEVSTGGVSDTLCNIISTDNTNLGNISVYKKDEFKVNCDSKTGRTHIIVNSKDEKYIEEHAINYKNETEPFWLDTLNSTARLLNLQDFYNGVKLNQIAWMQTKSLQVTQTIRYHCKNSYVNESPESALRLMAWNDIPIGPLPSDRNPIYYSIPASFTHQCKSGAPKDKWLYTDIVVRGSTKRLPVIDFYIKDIRGEDQSFFLELVELSFG